MYKLQDNKITFSDKSIKELKDMMVKINRILDVSLDMFLTGEIEHMQELYDLESEIYELERKLQSKHIQRLNKGKCSAHAGICFSDVVSGLERVSDHATNIALSVIEAKGLKEVPN